MTLDRIILVQDPEGIWINVRRLLCSKYILFNNLIFLHKHLIHRVRIPYLNSLSRRLQIIRMREV
jgi:hypothetical protein